MRMRFEFRTFLIAGATAACAVVAQSAVLGAISIAASGPEHAIEMASHQQAERVIEDPASGRRWVLIRDPEHPGGPGKLVDEAAGAAANAGETQKFARVIRAGDRVLVEVNTRVAHGLFEAIALSGARRGNEFRVRLRVGGRVVQAVAIGPGRAVLAGADEVRQ